MEENEFVGLKDRIIQTLSARLDPKLTYHSPYHTLDVLEQATRLAIAEGIKSQSDLRLLQIAALYHDYGFVSVYKGHEEVSCEIFMKEFKDAGLSGEDKKRICGMIMATKIPQNPTNLLEEIICDADLDYLGRTDFYIISERLKKEFLHFGIVQTEQEWESLQVKFFKSHRYFTKSSMQQRNPLKLQHLQELIMKLNKSK